MEVGLIFDLIQKYDGLIGVVAMLLITWLGTKFITRAYFEKWEAILDARLKALTDKVERAEDRIVIIEKDMEHLPDRDATHRLELAVLRLEGRLEAMDERIKPVAEMARRHQEHLLDQR